MKKLKTLRKIQRVYYFNQIEKNHSQKIKSENSYICVTI